MTDDGGSRAVVVGGGIGGLTAALGLRRRGWDVTVLERAPEIRPVGAGLVLTANGLAGLDAVGVGGAVRGAGYAGAPGGTRDARDLVEAFLGRPGGFEAWTRWLERDAAAEAG